MKEVSWYLSVSTSVIYEWHARVAKIDKNLLDNMIWALEIIKYKWPGSPCYHYNRGINKSQGNGWIDTDELKINLLLHMFSA